MKHWSLCLTALLLGGVPLAAAAVDYGPNQPLLADEGSAPQLPRAAAHDTSAGAIPKPDVDSADPAADAATQVHPVPPRATTPGQARARKAVAEDKKGRRAPPGTKPAHGHPQAAWQSLLPGSIQ